MTAALAPLRAALAALLRGPALATAARSLGIAPANLLRAARRVGLALEPLPAGRPRRA